MTEPGKGPRENYLRGRRPDLVVPQRQIGSDLTSSFLTDPNEPLAYDLEGWDLEERTALGLLLDGAGIAHSWDGDELLVPETAEEQVDELMDRIEFPDALEAVEDDGADDEAAYNVMSDLFVAVDRLAGADEFDVEAAGELTAAAGAATLAPPPYGVAPGQWQKVQELAEGILAAIDAQADDDVVRREVAALRGLLHPRV
ncbi:MAG: hypothetical protein ABIW46_07480 [Acidimicrobiales bacterium]